jgi:ACR3 family arsenite efflux pump ArsB
MLKKIFQYPAKNLTFIIPIILVIGFTTGLMVNLSWGKQFILPLTFFMIFPNMIGINLGKINIKDQKKVLLLSIMINFIIIPSIAYLIGNIFLTNHHDLFIGLMMMAVFPTSGMTISWTGFSKGNVIGAIQIVTVNLILSALLASVYLSFLLGSMVEVNMLSMFLTILEIVMLPLILGYFSHRLLVAKLGHEEFKEKIKPLLPSASVWAMLIIIFLSIGMKAKMIASNPKSIVLALIIVLALYLIHYTVITILVRKKLTKADSYAVIYGTVMRNLSIALGIAVSAFSPEAALIITLAYVVQIQSAPIYKNIAERFNFLEMQPILSKNSNL